MAAPGQAVVLAVGNVLGGDDGVGPQVVAAFAGEVLPGGARCVDGGTCGLALLPYVEGADVLVAVDAARLGDAPGTVRVAVGPAMDRQVGRARGRSVHEVGLAQLLGAAALAGALPARRALVSVEPERVGLGTELSPAVARALPLLRSRVREALIELRAGLQLGAGPGAPEPTP